MSRCARCDLESEWLRLRRSPLLSAGGVALFDGLFDARTREQLRFEALSPPGRLDALPEGRDRELVRGGLPGRRLISVQGGPRLASVYGDTKVAAFIANQVQLSVRLCGRQATYSIYEGEGAHLGPHRDVPGCDLALISCLHDNGPTEQSGAPPKSGSTM